MDSRWQPLLDRLDSGDLDEEEAQASGQPVQKKPEPARLSAMDLDGPSVAAIVSRLVGPVLVNGAPIRFSAKPQRASHPPEVEARLAAIDAERMKASEERAATLAEASIQGRSASPQELSAHLSQLGVRAPHPGMFRRPPRPPPAPEQQRTDDPETGRRRIESEAERKVAKLVRSGAPISARSLTREEYQALLRRHGITPAVSFAARGVSEG